MSGPDDSVASLHVHPEVRLRIVNREIMENSRRIYELCESLGIDPDSLSATWSKEEIGISDSPEEGPTISMAEVEVGSVFFTSRKFSTGGGRVERLRPDAERLEYHIKKQQILVNKAYDISEEKSNSPREWHITGHFHWCEECDQVFGCDSPDPLGNVTCTYCGAYGPF